MDLANFLRMIPLNHLVLQFDIMYFLILIFIIIWPQERLFYFLISIVIVCDFYLITTYFAAFSDSFVKHFPLRFFLIKVSILNSSILIITLQVYLMT